MGDQFSHAAEPKTCQSERLNNIWVKCMSETEPAITITFQPFVKAKQNPLPNGVFCRSYWGCRTPPMGSHPQARWVDRFSLWLPQKGISTKKGPQDCMGSWHELACQENRGTTERDGGKLWLPAAACRICPFYLQYQLLHQLSHLTWPLLQDSMCGPIHRLGRKSEEPVAKAGSGDVRARIT